MTVAITTFYKFVPIPDCADRAVGLRARLDALEIKGTVLLASEGINATLSGSVASIEALLTGLRCDPLFHDLTDKRSLADDHPFNRTKVKVRSEIVTFGLPHIDPTRIVGTYVPPEMWNALISDPNVVVIDTRNKNEVAVGTFAKARDPGTEKFSDFPKFVETHLSADKDRAIAMFCTGGIRCEKASSYLLSLGFKTVFHLDGGILKYLEMIPKAESLWQGECFIFDNRLALEHGVVPSRASSSRGSGASAG